MRKTVVTSLAALAALGLTGLAYAAPPDPSSATQPAAPTAPADPSAQYSPPPAASSQPPGAATSNTHLAALVPQGMSSEEACRGFSSATDCALVLHIAQNLNISFADLKGKLASGQSLTAALSTMKPGVDPQAEITKAEAQARSDMTGPG
jgi:hypothetical protein